MQKDRWCFETQLIIAVGSEKRRFKKLLTFHPFFPSPPASLWPSCGPNLSCNYIRSHQPLLLLDNSKYSLGKCLLKSMDALTIQNSSTRRVATLESSLIVKADILPIKSSFCSQFQHNGFKMTRSFFSN